MLSQVDIHYLLELQIRAIDIHISSEGGVYNIIREDISVLELNFPIAIFQWHQPVPFVQMLGRWTLKHIHVYQYIWNLGQKR